MAISAAGIQILLQSGNVQLKDLVDTLQPGDSLKGRVVELLPQNNAVINLRGQNVVAQLPANTSLAKGDILSLQVSQSTPGEGSQPSSLVLRLQAQTLATSLESPAGLGSSLSLLGQSSGLAQIEQALGAAKVPVNNVSVAVAQTLSSLGVSLEPATLNALVHATESLIANEQAPAQSGSGLNAPLQEAIQDGLAQVKIAAQLSPSSEQTVSLLQVARGLEAALQGGAVSVEGTASSAGQGTSGALAVEVALQNFNQALQGLLSQPTAAQAQNLVSALNQAVQAPQAGGSGLATGNAALPTSLGSNPAPSPAAPISASPAQSSATAPLAGTPSSGAASLAQSLGASVFDASQALNSAAIPAAREALAQWLGPMNQQPGGMNAAQASASAQALAESFSDPQSPATARLVAAVQAQSPQSTPSSIQATAVQVMQEVAAFYGQQPAGRVLNGAGTLQADLRSQGLPVPSADLASLPPETVGEAVAWLAARSLPPQRPLVETVATWMAQNRDAMPAAQRAAQAEANIPQESLDANPSLKLAFDSLQSALQSAAVRPDEEGLSERLQNWATQQGLTLESDLAGLGSGGSQGLSSFQGQAGSGAAAGQADKAASLAAGLAPAQSLRPALMNLENELRLALQSPTASGSASTALNNALGNVQAAARSFNAVPLQAQSAPAYDTVHLPLPVWMDGAFGDGHLSVSWKQGRERELDDKVPVNVAVSLNTEHLGAVTVSLQVWKSSASARVITQDKATADFMARGSEELRAGFTDRTPFRLSALDFAVAESGAPAPAAGPDAPGGLSLRA